MQPRNQPSRTREHHFNGLQRGTLGITQEQLDEAADLPTVYDWEITDSKLVSPKHITYMAYKTPDEAARRMEQIRKETGAGTLRLWRFAIPKSASLEYKVATRAISAERYGTSAQEAKRLRHQLNRLTRRTSKGTIVVR